jgi:hypothetical protein
LAIIVVRIVIGVSVTNGTKAVQLRDPLLDRGRQLRARRQRVEGVGEIPTLLVPGILLLLEEMSWSDLLEVNVRPGE